MAGCLAGLLAGVIDAWWAGWLACWQAAGLVGWLACWLASWLVSWLYGGGLMYLRSKLRTRILVSRSAIRSFREFGKRAVVIYEALENEPGQRRCFQYKQNPTRRVPHFLAAQGRDRHCGIHTGKENLLLGTAVRSSLSEC